MKKLWILLLCVLLVSFCAFAEETETALPETEMTESLETAQNAEPAEETVLEEIPEAEIKDAEIAEGEVSDVENAEEKTVEDEGLQSLSAEEPSLSVPEEIVLTVGDKKVTLPVEFTTNIEKDSIVLTSFDPKIVSVSGQKMTVKAKQPTETVITVTSTLSGLHAETHVTVVPKLKKIAFEKEALFLDRETVGSYTLKAQCLPEGSKGDIVYTSSNPNVIGIDAATGELRLNASGSVTITAKAGKLKATCRVTWMKKSEDTLSIDLPEEIAAKTSVKIAAVKANADAGILWSVENVTPAGAAKIDKKGTLKAVKGGSCTVVAELNDGSGVTVRKDVTIRAKASKVVITRADNGQTLKTVTLGIGGGVGSVVVNAAVTPEEASQNVVWTTTNASVAVYEEGAIVAKGDGKCTVTATAQDGSKKKASVKVTVKDGSIQAKASKVVITRADNGQTLKTVTLGIGGGVESVAVNVAVTPENASQNVVWTTTNAGVAVYEEGAIVAKGNGKCTVTATAQDGSKKKASVTVTVKEVCEDFYVVARDFEFGDEGTDNYYVFVGAKKKVALKAVSTTSGAEVPVKWAIDPDAKGYIKVDSKGNVTGVTTTDGFNARVIATLKDGTDRTKAVNIEVLPAVTDFSIITDRGKEVEKEYSWDRTRIEERLYEMTLYPKFDNAESYCFCKWTTTDPEIAAIQYENGRCKITFPNTKAGTVTVTAMTMDGTNKKVSIVFNITAQLHFEEAGEEIDVAKGKTVYVKPAYNKDATDTTLYWVPEDEEGPVSVVDELNNGGIKANGEVGSIGRIQVQADSGDMFVYTVHITKAISSFGVIADAPFVRAGDVVILRTDKPAGTTDHITWTSSNQSIATVRAAGNGTCIVEGVADGTVTITATLQDGSKVSSKIEIAVTE